MHLLILPTHQEQQFFKRYEPKLAIQGEDTQSAKPEDQVTTIKITNDGNGEDDISLSLIGGNASWGQLEIKLYSCRCK